MALGPVTLGRVTLGRGALALLCGLGGASGCKKSEPSPPQPSATISATALNQAKPSGLPAGTPAGVGSGAVGATAAVTSDAAGARFRALAERYFDEAYFRYRPSEGTATGFHQYDAQLEDFSKAAVAERAAACRSFKSEFARLDATMLDEPTRADLRLVQAHIDATLLELEELRMWARNPDVYSSQTSASAFTIISRTFAPPAERLRSLIAREKLMPALLQLARVNLETPPRVYCEVALSQLPGTLRFFEKDVPLAFKDVIDAALLAEFKATNTAVLAALRDYQAWLKTTLLPKCTGDFRLGTDRYVRKLLADEMVDTPLPRLLELGYADLRRNQQRFKEVAAKIDPSKTPLQILEALAKDHPPPAQLLQATRDVLHGLRAFIEQKKLVTIPSTVLPRVEETPPFLRALTMASMDTPGPYETRATEAFFNITLPEAGWSAKEVAEHMAGFNRGTILSTAIHEAYPGHYTQFLWLKRAKSKVRKLLGSNTNSEGWAHYVEDMIFDEGYGGGEPKLRLGQLQDALLRNARYVVGIELHTGKMTFAQGVEFFVKEGYQSPANAERETKRGTSDPTYLYYTLGKLQILKLRQDYQKKLGAKFTPGDFHDRFLAEGFPPIQIVRKALLGEDGPTL